MPHNVRGQQQYICSPSRPLISFMLQTYSLHSPVQLHDTILTILSIYDIFAHTSTWRSVCVHPHCKDGRGLASSSVSPSQNSCTNNIQRRGRAAQSFVQSPHPIPASRLGSGQCSIPKRESSSILLPGGPTMACHLSLLLIRWI